MKKTKRCCFAGHSKIFDSNEVYAKLLLFIERLIVEERVTEFWFGNYGDFDSLSAKAVRCLKSEYPHITLHLVIPYLTRVINNYKEQFYRKYDSILMAEIQENTPKRLLIIKCNEYMVRNSDFMICYVQHSWGGAVSVTADTRTPPEMV